MQHASSGLEDLVQEVAGMTPMWTKPSSGALTNSAQVHRHQTQLTGEPSSPTLAVARIRDRL